MARRKKRKVQPFDPARDTGRERPVYAQIAAREIADRYSDYPSRGLRPERLAHILQDADEGNLRAQMELYEEMEEKDAHLFSQMQTRKLAVTGLEWEVQPYSEEERDQQIADFVKEQLRSIENFDDVLTDLMDAVGKGVSIMELMWAVDEQGRNVVDDILYVHPKKLMWSWDREEMLICTEDHPEGMSLPENKFMVHQYKAKSGHPSRAGVMRIVAWMYLFKNYTVKDWVSFCEVYGMPLRLGKYDASASQRDKDELMDAIVRIGSDAAGIIPDTTMIEFKESNKTTSSEIYENMARYCDEQISKAVLGQTLTSDSGGGSYAQSKTHNEVRHDLITADAKALAVTLRRDLIAPLVRYNFGPLADLPFIVFDTQQEEDQSKKVDVYQKLICDIGLPVSRAHLYKTFAIPEPADDEELVTPPSKAVAAAASEAEAMKSLKASGDTQEQLDQMVEVASGVTAKIAKDAYLAPLTDLLDNWKGSLPELKEYLEKPENLKALYDKMDSDQMMDLLHQAGYLAGVIGRSEDE